jgi:hypothetical protein
LAENYNSQLQQGVGVAFYLTQIVNSALYQYRDKIFSENGRLQQNASQFRIPKARFFILNVLVYNIALREGGEVTGN